jgi:hypothetical protein
MYGFIIKDSVRQELVRVLSAKVKVNDTVALVLSMTGMFVAVLAVSFTPMNDVEQSISAAHGWGCG